jgi:hypothetical protein
MIRASCPSLTLSALEWKEVQTLIHTASQQQENAEVIAATKRIIQAIELAKKKSTDPDRVELVRPIADWRTLRDLLQPSGTFLKKDPTKEKKDHLIQLITDRIIAAADLVIVTTGDLKEPYDIIGPVYFQVSNKGIFSSKLSRLEQKHLDALRDMRKGGQIDRARLDWGFLYGEYSAGQNDFDKAFFVAVQELKKRALLIGGDAIIGMRQDIDLDTNAFQYFYLQMYGTAVRFNDQP